MVFFWMQEDKFGARSNCKVEKYLLLCFSLKLRIICVSRAFFFFGTGACDLRGSDCHICKMASVIPTRIMFTFVFHFA